MPIRDPEKRRQYHNAYTLRRYHEDPEYRQKHRKMVKGNNAKYHARNKALLTEFKSGGCLLCPEKEPCTLAAHHLDPSQKELRISDAVSARVPSDKIEAELKKCVCLCHNCHAKLHAGLLKIDAPIAQPVVAPVS